MPLNEEVARALVARLQASGHSAPHILDIASGSGEPACTIAQMLPSAEVLQPGLRPCRLCPMQIAGLTLTWYASIVHSPEPGL